jgi:hypothetical protein
MVRRMVMVLNGRHATKGAKKNQQLFFFLSSQFSHGPRFKSVARTDVVRNKIFRLQNTEVGLEQKMLYPVKKLHIRVHNSYLRTKLYLAILVRNRPERYLPLVIHQGTTGKKEIQSRLRKLTIISYARDIKSTL